jgi:dihydroorotate dehydrogenase (fumarate)
MIIYLKKKIIMDLSVKYLGLKLKNPIVIGSSGLTNSLENIIDFEKKGAGAVILKSLFQEQINFEESFTQNFESFDYIKN